MIRRPMLNEDLEEEFMADVFGNVDDEEYRFVESNERRYTELQEKFYVDNFSLIALQDSTDFQSFLSHLPLYTENDLVMNGDVPFVLVHQYDRNPELNTLITNKYK
jgi:hypothetical protein